MFFIFPFFWGGGGKQKKKNKSIIRTFSLSLQCISNNRLKSPMAWASSSDKSGAHPPYFF